MGIFGNGRAREKLERIIAQAPLPTSPLKVGGV
jgi:hypothetical protein